MAGEKERVEGYLDTVGRLEPDIHMIDPGAFYASAAISLRRIANAQISLRDYFAGLAMQAALAADVGSGGQREINASVRNAYQIADAMLEERE